MMECTYQSRSHTRICCRLEDRIWKKNIPDGIRQPLSLEYVTGQNNGWLFLHGSESAEQKEIAAYTDPSRNVPGIFHCSILPCAELAGLSLCE